MKSRTATRILVALCVLWIGSGCGREKAKQPPLVLPGPFEHEAHARYDAQSETLRYEGTYRCRDLSWGNELALLVDGQEGDRIQLVETQEKAPQKFTLEFNGLKPGEHKYEVWVVRDGKLEFSVAADTLAEP